MAKQSLRRHPGTSPSPQKFPRPQQSGGLLEFIEPCQPTVSMISALREHWPEYLIEFWAFGCFMMSVSYFVTLFDSPGSRVYSLIPNTGLRTSLLSIAIGTSATLLIQSPWGQRSGAHMNPAITLAFLRLGKIRPWDALFYALAQTIGGM